uniref:Uncharacterized protein n=1 Tax=Arundo donax TaxID=35708 RepID=A0A0A9BBU1_ARUDO
MSSSKYGMTLRIEVTCKLF